MLHASWLLLLIGLLGAFDVFYFHHHVAKLTTRPASKSEAWTHVARGGVYGLQFVIVPSFELHGRWVLALVALYAADIGVTLVDVWLEPGSRKDQGGLPRGEYVMHIVLSVIIGVYLSSVYGAAKGWADLPTGIVHAEGVPIALRVALGIMAVGTVGVAASELFVLMAGPVWLRRTLGSPRPVHVSMRLATDVPTLWRITQDHVLHPTWDHRFSRIEMLADEVRTGTEMLYEKRIMGVSIRGGGRYKLHRPMKQSTFEFWSDDRRSLIEHGVGLWLYRARASGTVEFSTSYTYRVRWGLFGAVVDRLLFRPWFQRETERSFRRLALRYFGQKVHVAGTDGRKPERLDASLDALAPGHAEAHA